jgi:flavin-dependent dehydrogenase
MGPRIVIVGAGVSGSSTAIHLLKQGIKPVIIDKASFPRDTVGEGLSPAIGPYLRDLGIEDDILSGPFTRKRSLQLVAPNGAKAYTSIDFDNPVYQNRIHNYPFGFNVRRRNFDMAFLNKAKELGAEVRLQTTANYFSIDPHGRIDAVRIELPNGGQETIETDLVVDCSGRSSALATQFDIRGKLESIYEGQWANFAVRCHFTNVDMTPFNHGNPDYEMATVNVLPYHNCWYWFIPLELDKGLISVGFVARSKVKSIFDGFEDKLSAYRALFDEHPVLKRALVQAEMLPDVATTARLGHMNKQMKGDGYLCVGDAGFFADPAWGTGVTISLATAKMAAEAIAANYESGNFSSKAFDGYEESFRKLINDPFNSIRAYNYYYNDNSYINWLVERLARKQHEMDVVGAVAFDYVSHNEFTKWTYRMAKDYMADTGSFPVLNAASAYRFEST